MKHSHWNLLAKPWGLCNLAAAYESRHASRIREKICGLHSFMPGEQVQWSSQHRGWTSSGTGRQLPRDHRKPFAAGGHRIAPEHRRSESRFPPQLAACYLATETNWGNPIRNVSQGNRGWGGVWSRAPVRLVTQAIELNPEPALTKLSYRPNRLAGGVGDGRIRSAA